MRKKSPKNSSKNSFFDRPQGGERAVLVHLNFAKSLLREDSDEFRELAKSAGVEPVAWVTGSRHAPDIKYFIGSGKAEEIRDIVASSQAEVVLINHTLTPSQERNLEALLECRVLDRTGLILDIFAQRARTFEGKLQVELAQLEHLATRLVRGWTHLERQKGGIGLRGPGETQLETDRRLLKNRVKLLKERLKKVRLQREQGRQYRQKHAVPTIVLVGYTNAGKSTLFNKLTSADVYAAKQLFATLDPTLRQIKIPEVGQVILADTVGFIRDLPHHLVEAFSATLEETINADLLLHVVDAHNPYRQNLIRDVQTVLKEIGADHVPQLMVYNKIDLASAIEPRIDNDDQNIPIRVNVSALTGAGLDLLKQAISTRIAKDIMACDITLHADEGGIRAALYELGAVTHEQSLEDGGWRISVRMRAEDYHRIMKS
ncbi:MAG: GTPase HflX [Gammaproteobacteria bacterium]|nr:GTPase HflX [Gammaproteobacteria bacterium]